MRMCNGILTFYHWFKVFYELLPASAKEGRDFEQFKQDADLMAVQRHIKILGFCSVYLNDGKSGASEKICHVWCGIYLKKANLMQNYNLSCNLFAIKDAEIWSI